MGHRKSGNVQGAKRNCEKVTLEEAKKLNAWATFLQDDPSKWTARTRHEVINNLEWKISAVQFALVAEEQMMLRREQEHVARMEALQNTTREDIVLVIFIGTWQIPWMIRRSWKRDAVLVVMQQIS